MKMYPMYFPIYKIIVGISIITGLIYILFAMRKAKLSKKKIILFIVCTIPIIITFGKLYTFIANPNQRNIIKAGLSSYGGLIGLVISAILFDKIYKTKGKILKNSIISLPLIYSIAKLACFVTGCCNGIPYSGPFNVVYIDDLNIPQFPIQLVESIEALIIFEYCYKKRNENNIECKSVFLIALSKFALDFLRYDHISKIITANQIFSLALVFITAFILLIKKKKSQTT